MSDESTSDESTSAEPYTLGPADPRPHGPAAAGWAPFPEGSAVPPAGVPYGAAADAGAVPNGAVPGGPVPYAAAPAAWGAKPAVEGRQRMSTVAKSLTAVGVAAVIAVGGTVAVTSANADNSTSASASPMGGGNYRTGAAGSGSNGGEGTTGAGRSGGFGGGWASRSLIAGALHGEFVVADGTGTVTERLQIGSVTGISSSSLTVKSTDDFTATYAIASGTDTSSLVAGTTVTVIAKVDGTALDVVSITASAQGGTSGGGPGYTGTGELGTGGPGTAPGSSTGTSGEDSGV